MSEKKYNIALAVIKRFLRTAIPQFIVLLPIIVEFAEELQEFMPLWVLPVLVCIASIVTAGDKLVRELKKLKK
jgi:hypothetical protein